MARFVCVHGAFGGAWIWGLVSERLNSAGHTVEAFDLPGMGDDQTPLSECTLDASATRLCDVLTSRPEMAIVVAHSMGGVIATQAAARCPQAIAALVFVAAFMPKHGQSLLDLTRLPEGAGDQVQANIRIEGEPPVAVMPDAASRQALYGSCSEDVAAWAIARHRPQPVAPFATPVAIPPGALDSIKRYYVLCARDRAIPPALQRRMIAENKISDVVELDTDHTPQLSMTNDLSKALLRFTNQASAGIGRAVTR